MSGETTRTIKLTLEVTAVYRVSDAIQMLLQNLSVNADGYYELSHEILKIECVKKEGERDE